MKITLIAIVAVAIAAPMLRAEDKPAAKPYPLKTCVVSGEKLGEHGKPYVFNYEGREVQFCCEDCVGDFKKDPAKYLKKLDEAAKK